MGVEAVDIKDPNAVAFFMSDLCGEADLVYRFGYALTLSEAGAAALVQDTFGSIVSQISRFLEMSSQQIRIELLKMAWGVFQDWKKDFKETDTPMLDFLYPIKRDIRVVLVLVDILGLSKSEAEDLLQLKSVELQRYLAEGRKYLLDNKN